MTSVGIVVPAYRPDVELLAAYVHTLDEEVDPAEIRIEIDAPFEGVEETLSALPATVNAVDGRRGKGAAITAGFEALDTDVLAFADADGSTPAESVADVIAPVVEGRAELAAGSRRHPKADVRSHQTYARRWLGDGFAWLARRLLTVGLYDYQCGAKAIDADAWERVRLHLYEAGFSWDIELIAMAGAFDCRVVEIPVVWEDQPESTVSPVRTSWELFRALLSVRHRAKLLGEHPIHSAIAARRRPPTALVDRPGPEDTHD